MKYWPIFSLLISLTFACGQNKAQTKVYPRMIGDIAFDATKDTAQFQLCSNQNMAVQYYAYTKITAEKPHAFEKYEVDKLFFKNYNDEIVTKESGLIRIRFMVNCKGKSGRYRLLGMDEKYKEKKFDSSITDQLLSITKDKITWKPFDTPTLVRDYYMYLIFKIESGKLVEILP